METKYTKLRLLASVQIVAAIAFATAGVSAQTVQPISEGEPAQQPQSIDGSSQGISRGNPIAEGAAEDVLETRRFVGGREVRTFDGSHNNLSQIEWGAADTQLVRLGFADYTDGVSSMAGALRASARDISNVVSSQRASKSALNAVNATDFVWQWGQFIDHDLGLTDGFHERHEISVPFADPYFDPARTGHATISFSRAAYDPGTGTHTDNPRQQINEITTWIDGSMVYGSSNERVAALRVGPDSALLKTSNGDRLPFNESSLPNANGFVADPTSLFLAGDVRANEQVGLAAMHTLFMREHNRLATQLRAENPTAPASHIFEEARRLVIAQIQHITYTEFLPALIGEDALPAYAGYDPVRNPGLYNEFSSAAFRLGHSMINTKLLRLNQRGREISDGHLSLRDAFFTAPTILDSRNSIDPVLRGLASQAHQRIDQMIVDDLRNFLFGQPGAGGLDLASLNIQRGRDHGVPSYNDMREIMGLSRVASFSDVTSDTWLQASLARVYPTVDDIDLWVGGLAEDPMLGEGAQVGPLLRAILSRQFADVRDADRFWYETYLEPDELAFVRGRKLSDVIRDNTNIGSELQDDVFHLSVPIGRGLSFPGFGFSN